MGLSYAHIDNAFFGLGYTVLLLSQWFWLSGLGFRRPAILTAAVATVAYGFAMFAYNWAHPADQYGAAMLCLTLGAACRNRYGVTLFLALLGGIVWQKHVLLGPVVLVHYLLEGRWKTAVALGSAVALAASIGPKSYEYWLGYHEIDPEGILTKEVWLRYLFVPSSMYLRQGVFVIPAVILLYLQRRVIPTSILASVVVYPAIILIYIYRRYYLFEMRSFWIVVPAFSAVLASYVQCQTESPGRMEPTFGETHQRNAWGQAS